jgi:hypothetical protein
LRVGPFLAPQFYKPIEGGIGFEITSLSSRYCRAAS